MSKIFQWLNAEVPLKSNEGIIYIAFDKNVFRLPEAQKMLVKAGLSSKMSSDSENYVFWQTPQDYKNFRQVQIIKGLSIRIGELI